MVHIQRIMEGHQLKWRDGKMCPSEGQGEGRSTWKGRRVSACSRKTKEASMSGVWGNTRAKRGPGRKRQTGM